MEAASGPNERNGGRSSHSYILVLLTLSYMLMAINQSVVGLTLQSIKRDLVLSDTALALIVGLGFSAAQAIVGLPMARWADRGDRRLILVAAMSFWSCMTVACGAAQTGLELAGARIGVGAGESVTPVQHAVLSDAFSKDRRAVALSIYGAGGPLSALIGYPLIGWLDQTHGWRTAFFAVGAPGLVLAAIFLFTLHDPRHHQTVKLPPAPPLGEVARTLWRRRSYWLCMAGYVISQFGVIGFVGWGPTMLRRIYHLTPTAMGGSLGLAQGLLGIVGGLAGAVIMARTARLGDHWKAIIPGLAIILAIPFMLAGALSGSAGVAVFCIAATACLAAFRYGPQFAIAVNTAGPRMRATASSVQGFVTAMVAASFGPTWVAMLDDRFGRALGPGVMRYAMASCVIFVLIGGGLVLFGAKFIARDIAEAEADVAPS